MKEILKEIVQDIKMDKGAINIAMVRPYLRAYSWFEEINEEMPIEEQNEIISQVLSE